MIGKIIGAIAGNQVSKRVQGLDTTTGTIIGMALPILLRRISPITLMAIAAGAYTCKLVTDQKDRRPEGQAPFPEPTRTQA